MNRDTLYQKTQDEITPFAFDRAVVSVFPDMIKRSVPGYETIIMMTGVLAQRHAMPGTRIYDLGCSLGASLLSMTQHIDDPDLSFIGIDNSPEMIKRCKQLLPEKNNIELLLQDIESTKIENASVVVMNFSLQFIPLSQRDAAIQSIANGTISDGILILSEKILFEDKKLNELNIELHHEFKKRNGYTEMEISQKREALENILIPETLDAHRSRILTAGFTKCEVWFQCFNFASLIAIK